MQAWPAPPRMKTAWNDISVGIRWNLLFSREPMSQRQGYPSGVSSDSPGHTDADAEIIEALVVVRQPRVRQMIEDD